MNTDELVSRCKAGDPAALDALFHTYRNGIFRLALSILDQVEDAEDAVQEVLIAAINGLDSFRGEASLRTWIYSITVNYCRNRLRKRRRLLTLIEHLQGLWRVSNQGKPHPEDAAIQSERDAWMWQAIHDFDEPHRMPVILRYYNRLSIREIAEILHLPEGTIHSRLNTARARLKKSLMEWEEKNNG